MCTTTKRQTVSDFELSKYLGKWYEIARFENKFEKGMTHVTAEYSIRDDGKVKVLNSGVRNGERIYANGVAKVPNENNPSALKVSFFWIFYSDYLIVDLCEDYSYSLVCSSNDDFLWILSRTPQLEQDKINKLIEKAQSLGFDTSRFYFVPQE